MSLNYTIKSEEVILKNEKKKNYATNSTIFNNNYYPNRRI